MFRDRQCVPWIHRGLNLLHKGDNCKMVLTWHRMWPKGEVTGEGGGFIASLGINWIDFMMSVQFKLMLSQLFQAILFPARNSLPETS